MAAGAALAHPEVRVLWIENKPPDLEMVTPARVFRRAAGALGGVEVGDGKIASWRSSKSGARHCKPTAPAVAGPHSRRGDGVRRRGPLETKGGVGEASKPGGLAGEVRGAWSLSGEQRWSSSWLGAASEVGEGRASPLLERGDGGSTVVGDRGGETGGVRLS